MLVVLTTEEVGMMDKEKRPAQFIFIMISHAIWWLSYVDRSKKNKYRWEVLNKLQKFGHVWSLHPSRVPVIEPRILCMGTRNVCPRLVMNVCVEWWNPPAVHGRLLVVSSYKVHYTSETMVILARAELGESSCLITGLFWFWSSRDISAPKYNYNKLI